MSLVAEPPESSLAWRGKGQDLLGPALTPPADRAGRVVDDNVDAADSLADLLQLRGHEARTAYDGAAALEVVGAFLPHLIFLDIAMPRMDGYQVARQLRQRPELGNPVIVAVTGFGRNEDLHMAREAGFDEHATKLMDPHLLTRLLRSAREEE